MATRRNTKPQARRSSGNSRGNSRSGGGLSAGTVFVVGAVIGAAVLFGAPKFLDKEGKDGFLRPKPNADAEPANLATEQRVADGEGVVARETPKPTATEPVAAGTDYDFYNVLPNKEVEMTPEQQVALDAAERRRKEQALAYEQRKAEAAALAAQTALSQTNSGVVVMPDATPSAAAALPKPVAAPAPVKKAVTTTAEPKAAPSAKPTALPKPVAVAPAKDRPVKAAAETAAQAPKPRAKAVAAYAKNPDVTTNAKGVAMVMPAAALDPTRTFEKPAAKTAAATNSGASRVLVQAGAYSDKDQAEKVKAKIAMLGLGARVESSTSGGNTVYRVRLGPYADNSDALANAKSTLSGGGLSAMEVRAN